MSGFYDSLINLVGKNNVFREEMLKAYTTFRIGGPADYLVRPATYTQIADVIKLAEECSVPYFILGNGSNILVSDKGYRGLIIHIQQNISHINIVGNKIKAGAGALLIKTAYEAKTHSLTGMEFASGIPGTVGGAVFMNAGAYGSEMRNIISSVKVLDKAFNIKDIPVHDMDFSYRHSIIEEQGMVVLEAEFMLEQGDMQQIEKEMKRLAESRQSKQPLSYPSAGSTFKRPEGNFAGKLIMDAGLRGAAVGDAMVSPKHCGFVVNNGKATAEDVRRLIKHIQDTVFEKFGVLLETEVKMLGDF